MTVSLAKLALYFFWQVWLQASPSSFSCVKGWLGTPDTEWFTSIAQGYDVDCGIYELFLLIEMSLEVYCMVFSVY